MNRNKKIAFTLAESMIAMSIIFLILVVYFSTRRSGAMTEKLGTSKVELVYEYSRMVHSLRRDMARSKKHVVHSKDHMEFILPKGRKVNYKISYKTPGKKCFINIHRTETGTAKPRPRKFFRNLVQAQMVFKEIKKCQGFARSVIQLRMLQKNTKDKRRFYYNVMPAESQFGGLNFGK
ncbi:hypothetical protein ACFL35_14190 [Candidatus Riflebacteria bacterium]